MHGNSLGPDVARVFAGVLAVCDQQGLIGREMFAIDGVKLPSNASKHRSGTRADYAARATKLEAAAVGIHDTRTAGGKALAFARAELRSGSAMRADTTYLINFNVSPLDSPEIANYSAYYRLPLGAMQSVQQQVDASNGRFGYSEITHQFVMPPPTGRPELTLFASRSRSDTGVQLGARSTVVSTPLLTIVSQDAGQNITLNEGLGGKLSLPLPPWKKLNASLSFGVDFKRYQQVSFNTNSFFATTYITNSDGTVNPISSTVNSPQPTRHSGVDYFPMNLGFSGSVPDAWGTTFFNAQANWNLGTVGKISHVAYTTNAPDHYLTVQAGLSREQRIYQDWTVLLHADGQWSRDPLFSNEQFGLGGTAGVRGYPDGAAYGDAGWRVMIEPRTPLTNIGMIDAGYGEIPFWMRASVFLDYGELYMVGKLPAGLPASSRYCGTGCALTANIGSHLDARVSVAWPLIRHAGASEGLRLYFGLGAQF